jgi:hypothetical protein
MSKFLNFININVPSVYNAINNFQIIFEIFKNYSHFLNLLNLISIFFNENCLLL